MNPLSTLISRCLAGEASRQDWDALDHRIAADPAAAALWVRENRLHSLLGKLPGPLVAASENTCGARHRGRIAAILALAGAAAVAALLIISFRATGAVTSAGRLSPSLAESRGPVPSPADQAVPAENPADTSSKDPAASTAAVPELLEKVETTEKVIALRFADGPSPYTARLLDMLKAEGVPATFFCMGRQVRAYPELARRMIAEGHEIGNHTVSHPTLTRLDDDKVRAEVRDCQTAIQRATGVIPVLFEPPYAALTDAQRTLIWREFGCRSVLWSVDPLDWKYRDTDRITESVVKGIAPGALVLLHEIHPTTVEAVPEILRRLKADGWKFKTVSALIASGKR